MYVSSFGLFDKMFGKKKEGAADKKETATEKAQAPQKT
jgi:hypothetical protein